ncbi:MAG: PAS domain S-box protein, partial [Thermodesulfobacteriota bacterium]|nr:PAS domain S-box protein [Thermodesulfobacteriota bacterium]
MVTKPTYEELEQRVRELEKQSREREQAEEQIALFRRFAETSGQGLGMADLEGRITYANLTLCRLMGEERPEDPIGKPVQTYYTEQDLPRLENQILPKVFKKDQEKAEIPLLSIKGELTPTIQNIFLIRNDKGEPVCLANILTDITDRKKAEMELQRHHDHLEELVAERATTLKRTNEKLQREIAERKQAKAALRESEQKYRELVDLLPQTVFEIDKEGNVKFTNRCGFRSFGYCQEDLDKGLKASQMVIPEDRDRMTQNMREVLTSQEPGRNEYTALKKDGGTVPIITFSSPIVRDGQPVGLRGIVIDITELKQAEKKLRESEERLRLAMDAGDHGFWDWDLDTDEVYFSPRYYTMLGYEPGELPMVKDTWTGLMHPEDRETIVPQVQNYVENAERYEVEFRLKCKDGSWKWISGKGKGFELDENGRPWRAVGLHVDITERKQAEREKKRLESQLRQAQKMEAIGTLAGGIAHDFNNILAAIIGYTELSFDEAQEGSSLQENLKEIFSAGNRAKDLVKQILAFSREAEQKSAPVKVGRIAKEALKLLRASLPTTIAIRQDVQSDSTILADSTQIHQVFMNLCANAGQAMEEKGGTLDVSLVDVELGSDFTVKHPGTRPGPYIKLTVSDTGHGMAPDVLGRIFDPYFSTKEPDEGTGLGLSVVHGIARSCGGTITAHSEPGKGSTFHVFFPVIESKAEVE